LTQALREHERTARRLVLDLSKLRFLDSAGLALLIAQHRRAQQDGTQFAIANASGDVRRVLAISGLDRLLPSA
jgi:anti-sigma B factor antagonist